MTAPFALGIDRLLAEPDLRARLAGRRLALLGHPASVTSRLTHSLDALDRRRDLEVTCAFGPQHGMRGEKQDNMIESADYADPVRGIPVFSLYGSVRRPTPEMLDAFDVLLVDLQDLGCRVYTYLTTVLYLLEDCARAGKPVWILDRPNPAGRAVEGASLRPGHESFVGAAPIPMRHGLTLGEAARWYAAARDLGVDLEVVAMRGYDPAAAPGYGWPEGILAWVNPSPNASSVSMARCYPGTVLLEGTVLSEGRGTSLPLELVGAPELAVGDLLREMERLAPEWLAGCKLRPCVFEPTSGKHAGVPCAGFQIHAAPPFHDPARFRPYRIVVLLLRAIRLLQPDTVLWRSPPYEYETERLPIDVIAGGPALREWVDGTADPADLERALAADEEDWERAREPFLLYG